MIPLHNRKIAILGGGRSGLAAAALARREGAIPVMFDGAEGSAAEKARARATELLPGLEFIAGEEAGLTCGRSFPLLIASPGIDLTTGWGKAMSTLAETSIGEIEFASWFYRGYVVGITGTNGKTTTTEMIRDLLLAGGFSALAAGNHGLPLAEVVLQHPEADALALELSSFQLETIGTFRPDVAVWLNFAPDHMDRYRDLMDYRLAKENIYRNLRSTDTAIVPPCEVERATASGARVVTFAVDGPADWEIRDGNICRHGEPIMALDDVAVRGRHNHANLLAAWAAARAAGVGDEAAREVFARLQTPPHRYERVRHLDGVDYINDSKSTNLHSLETALSAEKNQAILIAGGKEKGLDYSELVGLVGTTCRAVIAIGEIGPKLRGIFAGVENHGAADLEEAVLLARRLARPGDRVLLSPGTSSFDMFRDYNHRGEVFRMIASNLSS
ncbi:MAG: UDP-N-acetylmuramoyl-L-alanine--D-glutamate ligase [Verrucomicrobiales bacterium]